MSADISRSDSLFDVLVCPVTISLEDTNVKMEKTSGVRDVREVW